MELILSGLLIFIVVSIIYSVIYLRKLKKDGIKKIHEINFLIKRYNLDSKKIKSKQVVITISLINGFIISFVSTLMGYAAVDNMFYMLLGFIISFIVLMAMIFSIYEIYGRFLNKRVGK